MQEREGLLFPPHRCNSEHLEMKIVRRNSKGSKGFSIYKFPMRLNCNFYSLYSISTMVALQCFHHCCALLLFVNKMWFYSSAMPRLVLQDAHNTLDSASLWLMNTTEKCNIKTDGHSNLPHRDLAAHPNYVAQSCAVRHPATHSHTEVGAWSPKQESHARENKATHEAYELWHKSHRWASPPFKGRFVPTISCLVYALHNMLLKLTTFKLVGYFVATSGRQRICNSNLVSFSFSQTDELSSASSCFSP